MREASFRDATLSSRMTSLIRAGACGCDCCSGGDPKASPEVPDLKFCQINIATGDGLWIVGKLSAKLVQLVLGRLQLRFSLSSLGLLQSVIAGVGGAGASGCRGVATLACFGEDSEGAAGALDAGDCTAMSSLREDYRRCCGIRFMLASVERGIHD